MNTAGQPVRLCSFSRRRPADTRLAECSAALLARPGDLDGGFVARGAGRSFGDAAYNGGGHTLSTRPLAGVSHFDRDRGELSCLAGTTMEALGDLLEGTGWTLPVAGGTRHATVGGAVAADIHGKNHVSAGSFGNHLLGLELITADGAVHALSPGDELFAATVGGMGLTGLVRSVRLRLARAPGQALRWRTRPFQSVDAMLAAFEGPGEHQAAWLDLASGSFRGLHHAADPVDDPAPPRQRVVSARLPRLRLLNRATVRALNDVVYRRQQGLDRLVDWRDLAWSTDVVQHGHNLYGPRGFHEYQLLVAAERAGEILRTLLAEGRRAGLRAWFATVKRLGPRPPAGLLSFPRAGLTIVVDYAWHPEADAFFVSFSDRVLAVGGRFYLAKDAHLRPAQAHAALPELARWQAITRRADPQGRVRSSLSTRLELKPWA